LGLQQVDAKFLAALAIKNSNNWNLVWKAVRQMDHDRNGFIELEELESVLRENFYYELN